MRASGNPLSISGRAATFRNAPSSWPTSSNSWSNPTNSSTGCCNACRSGCSLRTIVIVAALSVVVLVLTLGVWVWVGVTNDQYSQLDRRLDSVSSLGDFSTLLSAPCGLAAHRRRTATWCGPSGSAGWRCRPQRHRAAEAGRRLWNTSINGVEYRVRTFSVGAASIALGAPLAETESG